MQEARGAVGGKGVAGDQGVAAATPAAPPIDIYIYIRVVVTPVSRFFYRYTCSRACRAIHPSIQYIRGGGDIYLYTHLQPRVQRHLSIYPISVYTYIYLQPRVHSHLAELQPVGKGHGGGRAARPQLHLKEVSSEQSRQVVVHVSSWACVRIGLTLKMCTMHMAFAPPASRHSAGW